MQNGCYSESDDVLCVDYLDSCDSCFVYELCLSENLYEKKEDKSDIYADLFLASCILEGTFEGKVVKPKTAQVSL